MRGGAPGPQRGGSRRPARPEPAAPQHSPRLAQRGGDAGIARISLHRVPRPGAFGRLFFLPWSPGRERRPSRVRHVRGWVAPQPAGPPARPRSHPPAGRPAGESRGRQVGVGPGGAAGGEGREGGPAGRGCPPAVLRRCTSGSASSLLGK